MRSFWPPLIRSSNDRDAKSTPSSGWLHGRRFQRPQKNLIRILDANRAVQNGYDVFIFRMPTFSPEFTKVGSPSLSLSDIVCGSLIAPGPQELGGFHDPTLHCLISAYSIRGHLSEGESDTGCRGNRWTKWVTYAKWLCQDCSAIQFIALVSLFSRDGWWWILVCPNFHIQYGYLVSAEPRPHLIQVPLTVKAFSCTV